MTRPNAAKPYQQRPLGDPMNAEIIVRMNAADRDKVRAIATAAEKGMSTWVRELVLRELDRMGGIRLGEPRR